LNLPKKDGFSVCEEIRKMSIVPIIILSARIHEDDKVRALELGADDYISKPFSPRELIARIGTILKRLGKKTGEDVKESIITFGPLSLNKGEYILKISDKIIKTTKTEFLILSYLIDHRDHIVERETLMKEIIGYDHYLYDRTIDTHMKNLRKKIGDTVIIETIR
jgi:two-component system response regulator BaeR